MKTKLSESEEAEEPTNHKTMVGIKDNTSVQKRYKTNKQTLALLFVVFYFGVSALSDRRAIPAKQSPSKSFSEAIPRLWPPCLSVQGNCWLFSYRDMWLVSYTAHFLLCLERFASKVIKDHGWENLAVATKKTVRHTIQGHKCTTKRKQDCFRLVI